MSKLLQINSADNVAVALKPLKKGESFEVGGIAITVLCDVPFGHKVALKNLKKGEEIVKYGHTIGIAQCDIACGDWVSDRNIKTALGELLSYTYNPVKSCSIKDATEHATFNGYLRKNGKVGVRNELWIIPTVSCVNAVAQKMAAEFSKTEYAKYTDGVFAIPHTYGCSQLGCDHENTRKILRGLTLHPNAGGVLVLGLGCENNRLSKFKDFLGDYDSDRICFMQAQDFSDEVAQGFEILKSLALKMKEDSRTQLPLSKLSIGLKCGGSDGFSGITANPLIGAFSDMAITKGASCVLTEVPEMFGAETLLMQRACNKEVFEKIVEMINSFKEYFMSYKMPVYENPSPGNRDGGISTLEEKSLGCVQKGGHALVRDVLMYGDFVKSAGLSLLTSPGNDPVATTTLAAAGCQIILFSTGRGTPWGAAVPTIKIATNTPLSENKSNWIDFNAGEIANGKPICELAKEFFDFVVEVANGKKTKSEQNGYKEIAIFKNGVTL